MKVASLFSGVGGLDLGFIQAGFETIYANDISKDVWETYELNLGIKVDKRSLFEVSSKEIPKVDGIIGGPPCQSWSLAGEMRGVDDERGRLFYEYVRVIEDLNPKFFVAENVPGISSITHRREFKNITNKLEGIGYKVRTNVYDSRNYGVPQERRRVIIVGYRKDLGLTFVKPEPTHSKEVGSNLTGEGKPRWLTLKDTISNLPEAVPSLDKNRPNPNVHFPNHEYLVGDFSSIYMSRNRRRTWEQQSYTIQAESRPVNDSIILVSENKSFTTLLLSKMPLFMACTSISETTTETIILICPLFAIKWLSPRLNTFKDADEKYAAALK